MAITSYDNIISQRASGNAQDVYWVKTTSVTPVAGNWFSFLRSAGNPGTITASGGNNGALMYNDNSGSINLGDATSTTDRYLLSAGISVPAVNGFSAMMLVDVVWLANYATSASPGSVSMPALTRYTSGQGLQIGCAVSTTFGAFTPTITVTYNAPEGNSHTTNTGAFASALASPKMMPLATPYLPLAAGDTGVTAITNVALDTTNATGAFDLFLYKPLMIIPTIAAYSFIEKDLSANIDGITRLDKHSSTYKNGCLCWLGLGGGTNAMANSQGMIRSVKG
jgi:hypothetical protein